MLAMIKLSLQLLLLALGKTNSPFLFCCINEARDGGKKKNKKTLPAIRSFPSRAGLFSATLRKGVMRNGHMLQSALPCHTGVCVPAGTTGRRVILALPGLTNAMKIKAPEGHCTKRYLFIPEVTFNSFDVAEAPILSFTPTNN